jgi:nucleoside-diphosphate-sugar epimerase
MRAPAQGGGMTEERVLVTGGSGFIAGHVILRLLADGYRVRATLRSLDREPVVRERLAAAGAVPGAGERLEFAAADLLDDAGWTAALDGVGHVLHVASPVPAGGVAHGDVDLVTPAREGTLRVLRAAHAAGIHRVVLTSAFHAIGFGSGIREAAFTEADWSPLDGPGMDEYGRSKVLAERAAWDFVQGEGAGMELVALNPVAVLGPVLGPDLSGGNAILRGLLAGAIPALPDLWLPIVDVRDVAAAHVAAMTVPDAAGQRFLIGGGGGLTVAEIGGILHEELGERAARVPTEAGPANPALAWVKPIDFSRARTVLGLAPRPPRETVVDAAESIVAAGLAR